LHTTLTWFATFKIRVEAIPRAAAYQSRELAENARLDETTRAARMAAKPKSHVTTTAVPPTPADILATTGNTPMVRIAGGDSYAVRNGGGITPFEQRLIDRMGQPKEAAAQDG
jgi:hypothetical protein